jgi:hypothetical protein
MAPLPHAFASTYTKFAAAKINAASILSPMRCHSVASGTANRTTLSNMQSFSVDHMMPSFAFTMAQGRQHQFVAERRNALVRRTRKTSVSRGSAFSRARRPDDLTFLNGESKLPTRAIVLGAFACIRLAMVLGRATYDIMATRTGPHEVSTILPIAYGTV